jgi:hypothetical protein
MMGWDGTGWEERSKGVRLHTHRVGGHDVRSVEEVSDAAEADGLAPAKWGRRWGEIECEEREMEMRHDVR